MAGLDYRVIFFFEASLGFLFLNTNCKKTQKHCGVVGTYYI